MRSSCAELPSNARIKFDLAVRTFVYMYLDALRSHGSVANFKNREALIAEQE